MSQLRKTYHKMLPAARTGLKRTCAMLEGRARVTIHDRMTQQSMVNLLCLWLPDQDLDWLEKELAPYAQRYGPALADDGDETPKPGQSLPVHPAPTRPTQRGKGREGA